jgi:hypothetical protein
VDNPVWARKLGEFDLGGDLSPAIRKGIGERRDDIRKVKRFKRKSRGGRSER